MKSCLRSSRKCFRASHAGTALYVGYNPNLQNLGPSLTVLPSGNLARTRHPFTNDARQFFVKFSYLFRF